MMSKLIRSKRTQAFLKPDLTWTFDIHQAMHLADPRVPKPLLASLTQDDVELYYSFAKDRVTQWDFAVPAE